MRIDAQPRGPERTAARAQTGGEPLAERDARFYSQMYLIRRVEQMLLDLFSQGLLNGTVRLAYEVGESKSDGGESRISGTSLDDMRNNVIGIRVAYQTIFAAHIAARDAKLAATVQTKVDALQSLLEVRDLKRVDITKLRHISEELVLALQSAAPKLGLAKPTLEAAQ